MKKNCKKYLTNFELTQVGGGLACQCNCRDGWSPGIADTLMECHLVCARILPNVVNPTSWLHAAEVDILPYWEARGMANCTRPLGT